jgi:hypothetical protein
MSEHTAYRGPIDDDPDAGGPADNAPVHDPAHATPPTTNTRGPAARHYVVGGKIERRIGAVTETIEVPTQHRDALAIEGMIALLNKGRLVHAIHSGAALPDRSPPAEKAAPKPKQPTKLQRAVSVVLAYSIARDAKKAGAVMNKAAAEAQAAAEVSAMTAEDLASEAKKQDVRIEMIRLTKPRA